MTPSVWAEVGADLRGVFSDVDDTLTDEGVLVPAAYEALATLAASGLRVVLVTGRPRGWAEVMAALFPIDAAIAENGAVAALRDGTRLYYEDEETRRDGRVRRAAARAHVLTEMPWVRPSRDEALREIDLAFDANEHENLSDADVLRIARILEGHGLSTTRSSIHLHGTFSRADKAKMAVRVASTLWARRRATCAVATFSSATRRTTHPPSRSSSDHRREQRRASLPALDHLDATPWCITRGRGGHGFEEAAAQIVSARLTHKRP